MNSKRLQLLIDRHQLLDDQVDALSAKRVLLPSEQMELKVLKVIRLQAKEAIDRFKRNQKGERV